MNTPRSLVGEVESWPVQLLRGRMDMLSSHMREMEGFLLQVLRDHMNTL